MSNPTDTNQASEDEQTKAIYEAMQIHYLSERHDAINAIIRTEKLKLLAEVRERVVGEDDVFVDVPIVDHTGEVTSIIDGKSFTPYMVAKNHLRANQRAELTKLEAEL